MTHYRPMMPGDIVLAASKIRVDLLRDMLRPEEHAIALHPAHYKMLRQDLFPTDADPNGGGRVDRLVGMLVVVDAEADAPRLHTDFPIVIVRRNP